MNNHQWPIIVAGKTIPWSLESDLWVWTYYCTGCILNKGSPLRDKWRLTSYQYPPTKLCVCRAAPTPGKDNLSTSWECLQNLSAQNILQIGHIGHYLYSVWPRLNYLFFLKQLSHYENDDNNNYYSQDNLVDSESEKHILTRRQEFW